MKMKMMMMMMMMMMTMMMMMKMMMMVAIMVMNRKSKDHVYWKWKYSIPKLTQKLSQMWNINMKQNEILICLPRKPPPPPPPLTHPHTPTYTRRHIWIKIIYKYIKWSQEIQICKEGINVSHKTSTIPCLVSDGRSLVACGLVYRDKRNMSTLHDTKCVGERLGLTPLTALRSYLIEQGYDNELQ